jgi:cardiolipin synthase
MKGVTVEIALPEKSNLKMVHWAAWAGLEDLIKAGCHIMLTPPPFDHSKAMVVDKRWVLLGSANWDSRSLKLNFEFNVEVYDSDLARDLEHLLRERNRGGTVLSLEAIQQRSLAIRLRDSVFRLFAPYL